MSQFPADQRDTQIPKKGDRRQMEAWPRIGTYAAGLALDSAGIKGDREILARTDNAKGSQSVPVSVPTKFELTVNVMTAKALNLTMPATILACADDVIR
jgi:3-oxoacyl-(acyl-carrier-protein) synthase